MSNFEIPCLYGNSILVTCLCCHVQEIGVYFYKFYDTSLSYYFQLDHLMSVSHK